jgi:glyoxylase-like metal-dependent hydrolase (beta-lactamase superfamily II)
LLLETDARGLVLVDTGIGVDDVRDTRRLGAFFGPGTRVDATKTRMPALSQIPALGFRREDVRHILLTRLDFDHAGGLPDFSRSRRSRSCAREGSGPRARGLHGKSGATSRFTSRTARASRRTRRARLAELAQREDVTVFSAHDPAEFERLRRR